MKIFLNERSIEIVPCPQTPATAADMVIESADTMTIRESWERFLKDVQIRRMVICEEGARDSRNRTPGEVFLSFFKPVAAAGGIVKNERGEYLFIRRMGMWDLPKGKIDRADHLRAGSDGANLTPERVAAIREVQEETGLRELRIIRELNQSRHIFYGKYRWIIKITSWFEMEGSSHDPLRPQESEKITEARWIDPTDIDPVLSGSYASIRELVTTSLF